MSIAEVLQMAHALHRGFCIYHRKADCVAVLSALRATRPSWWDSECDEFLTKVDRVPIVSRQSHHTYPIIGVEGLDGVGKTTITKDLAEKLGGALVRTPHPQLEPLRAKFRRLDEPLARAFYCGANYLAAPETLELTRKQPVVVDRWWCSTCAMALSREGNPSRLPPAGDPVYEWPRDLPTMSLGILLDVDEAIRIGRMKKRGDEIEEEKKLAANEGLRRAAMLAYRNMNVLENVNAPNYKSAVNDILDLLETKVKFTHNVKKYSAEEVRTLPPF